MLGGIDVKAQSGLTDVQLLQKLKWLPGQGTKTVRKAAVGGDAAAFVLASRSRLQPFADRLRKRLGRNRLSLLSGLALPPDSLAARFTNSDGQTADPDLGESLCQWLALQPLTGTNLPPCDSVLILQLLLDPPIDTQVETWLRLWRLVSTTVSPSKSRTKPGILAETIATATRFAGALLFEPLKGSKSLQHDSREALERTLLEMTDSDGTPAAAVVENLRAWLATFVRASEFSRAFKSPLFAGATAERYRLFIQRAIELSNGGHFAFEGQPTVDTDALLRIAAKSAGWSAQTKVGALARGRKVKGGKKKGKQRVDPAVQSDWARFAYCRSDHTSNADLLAISHSEATPNISLNCFGAAVLSGPWRTTLTVREKPVAATGKWDCTCWHSDEDGDYIELRWSRQRLHIDRQIFLSRTHRFAILMDSATGRRDSALSVDLSLRIAPNVMNQADFVSREWRLHTDTVPVRAFPVSLDFDRVHNALGDFTVEEDTIRYAVTGKQAVQAALVLDWHPKRRTADTDWQSLTVTEDRQALASAQATAFRLRVGKHQLVSYRNMDGSEELRAVMGHHSDHETIIARFGKKGLEPLVLVDP